MLDHQPPYLILVKHSLPVIDPGIPPSRWALSSEGIARCTNLARHLAVFKLCQVISSYELKAMQTAAQVASQLGLPWQPRPDLHEHQRESAGFSTPTQFQASVKALFDHPSELVYGSETADQAFLRFSRAIESLSVEYKNQAVEAGSLVVVSHGTVISLYVSRTCGLAPFPLWQQLGLPSCVILTWGEDHIQSRLVEIIPDMSGTSKEP